MRRWNTVLLIALLLFLVPKNNYGQLKVDYYMTQGRKSISTKSYPEAIQYFNAIIASYENLYEAYFLRGVAKFYLGDFIGAENDFNDAITIKPYYPKAYYFRALTKDRLKQFHQALQDYNKAIDQEPNNASTYINRGVAKILLNYYYSAIEDCEYSIKINPNIENSYICLGLANMGLENYEEAIEQFNKALRFNQFNEETYSKRGVARKELKLYEDALADFNQALLLDSLNIRAMFHRAMLYDDWEKYDLAMKDYNQVLELDPENAVVYFNRAILKGKIEEYKSAIEDYDKVIELAPKNVLSYFNRALTKCRLGYDKSALEDFNKSIEIFPDFGEAYYNRAILKRNLGDYLGAEQDYNRAGYINEKYKDLSFSQKSINEYIELDADFESKKYNRDQVQNRFVDIQLKEKFVISFQFGEDGGDNLKTFFFNPLLTYNKAHPNSLQFNMVNKDKKLSPDDIYTLLNILNTRIEEDADNAANYFNRAVLKGRIEDYNGAIDDYNKAIELDPKFLFAYFGRANIRVDLINLLNTFETNSNSYDDIENSKSDENYEMVLADYHKALDLDPSFSYAWHNLANFNVYMNDMDRAKMNYGNAIEASTNSLAESYFNRALIEIFKKNTKNACLDLGKSGELGITDAYNVIKRYCNK